MRNDVKISYAICYNYLANISEKIMEVPKFWHRYKKKEH